MHDFCHHYWLVPCVPGKKEMGEIQSKTRVAASEGVSSKIVDKSDKGLIMPTNKFVCASVDQRSFEPFFLF